MINLVPGNEPPSFEFTPDAGPLGGYAFPHKPSRTEPVGAGMFVCHPGDQPGMSLRDYFAAKAMQMLLNDPDAMRRDGYWADYVASQAYWVADAMLRERAK